jgi:hypothetical protein
MELVETAAEIRKGTFRPVAFVVDLQFQINVGIIIHPDVDVKNKILVVNRFTKLDGVGDFERPDCVQVEMKQRTDQMFQHFLVLLEKCPEHIIVDKGIADGPGSIAQCLGERRCC